MIRSAIEDFIAKGLCDPALSASVYKAIRQSAAYWTEGDNAGVATACHNLTKLFARGEVSRGDVGRAAAPQVDKLSAGGVTAPTSVSHDQYTSGSTVRVGAKQ